MNVDQNPGSIIATRLGVIVTHDRSIAIGVRDSNSFVEELPDIVGKATLVKHTKPWAHVCAFLYLSHRRVSHVGRASVVWSVVAVVYGLVLWAVGWLWLS